jgi:hypothetical protein
MATHEDRHSDRRADADLNERAAQALQSAPSHSVPEKDWQRMKARAEWERQSRTSDLQVSGRLPD